MTAASFAVLTGAASAAPTVGPSGSAFYTPPSPLPAGTHGSLVWYRTATANLGTGAPSAKAWNILYRTEDANGASDLATGTVLVPTAGWTGSGTRPVVDYAPGTQGLGSGCEPSAQLAAGTEYESANIAALLAKGYAVVVTDYQGYTQGSSSLYIIGAAEGHAVLDAATAADQIPSVGITSSSRTAIWGYSQGGGASLWAATLEPSYDSSMNLIGDAAGGVPANLLETANWLNGNSAAGFAGDAVIGLADQYPSDINLSALENAQGQQAIGNLQNECVFSTLFGYNDQNLNSYLAAPNTLSSLESEPAIAADIQAQDLGSTPIHVPLYQYHGQADEVIPLDEDTTLKKEYCSEGVTDDFQLYPSEHITTQYEAAAPVISWISGRVSGTSAPNDCSDTAATPVSTAPAPGGDFDIALKDSLSGTMNLKSFGGTVSLPSSSTFTGLSDANAGTLTGGELSIPPFWTNLTLLGLPTQAAIQIVQDSPASGTINVNTTTGQLTIKGSVNLTLKLPTINVLGLGIEQSSSCETSGAVNIPLNYSGPLSALGDGITFSGYTTFPSLQGCGFLNGIISALFAGQGQGFSFTVKPPAPTSW